MKRRPPAAGAGGGSGRGSGLPVEAAASAVRVPAAVDPPGAAARARLARGG